MHLPAISLAESMAACTPSAFLPPTRAKIDLPASPAAQLYEAAAVDGAGRLRQTWSITLPCIINTITFIIIMRASSIMGSDTEQVMMFYSPIVYGVGDVLGTFVYREGIENAKFSYTTAVGLFGSVVGMIMMLGANYVSRKYTDKGIW